MSLIECPVCRKEISEEASSCPQCGHPIAISDRPWIDFPKFREYEKKLVPILGPLTRNAVGLASSWLSLRQLDISLKLIDRKEALLRKRNVTQSVEISPSVAVPLLEAASMESRDELLEWWARLLANAQDPERADGVRVSIVKAVKDFDPIDAVVLEGLRRAPDGHYKPDRLAEDLERRSDEIQSSVWRLGQLGVLVAHARANELARSFGVTPFGREILRATQP